MDDDSTQAYHYGRLCGDLVRIYNESGIDGVGLIVASMEREDINRCFSLLIEYMADND